MMTPQYLSERLTSIIEDLEDIHLGVKQLVDSTNTVSNNES